MSNVHPLVPVRTGRPVLAVGPAAARSGGRASWLAACDQAWLAVHDDVPEGDPPRTPSLDAVRAARREAEAAGDEFAVAAADVVLLDDAARRGDLARALSGLVPAAADLDTYPPSVWGARAEEVFGRIFAAIGERDLAVVHERRRQGIAESLEDLTTQARAATGVAMATPDGAERLDAFAVAESLFARASLDDDLAVRAGVVARYERALTHLRLGLVAAAAEQLPGVVELSRRVRMSRQEALARAAEAQCRGLSGEPEQGCAVARDALRIGRGLVPSARLDVELACARAFAVCGRPDLVVAALDTARARSDRDPARREAALTALAEAYRLLAAPDRAFECLSEADDVRRTEGARAAATRVEAMREYRRSCAAERELAVQRDLSARLLDQIAHLGLEPGPSAGEVAVRDDVTGLPNRRYLDLELRWRCAQRLPADGVLGLTLVTVDRYDAYRAEGPAAADRVARLVGQVVRGNVRGGDAVARFTHDTFAVVQFHRSPDAVRFAAERLAGAVRSFPWSDHGVPQVVTASVGAGALMPPTTPGALVNAALGALGRVVADGGDGVQWSSPRTRTVDVGGYGLSAVAPDR